jgi:hypothetical protein
MIATLRLLVCASALALAGYILALAYPDWLVHLGTDLGSLPELRADLDEELEFGRRLEEQGAAVLARAQAKRQLLIDLIDGRLTLVETATRFQDVDRELAKWQVERLRAIWPGSCQVERYCHQIIQVAEWELSEHPDRAAAVVARLKAELQAATESGAFCSLE